jgi:hypothetical protein
LRRLTYDKVQRITTAKAKGKNYKGALLDALIQYWVVHYLKESYLWSTITQLPLIASDSSSEIPLQFLVPTIRDKFIELVLIACFQSYPESVLAKFMGKRQAEPSPRANDWFS